MSEKLCILTEQTPKSNMSKKSWKPLVLVIPLRLGISTINPAYVQGVKVSNLKHFVYFYGFFTLFVFFSTLIL